MNKLVLPLIVAAMMTCACSEIPLSVYNACSGTWAEVYRGNNTQLVNHLAYGDLAPVQLDAWRGQSIELFAILHEATTSRVVGNAQQWVRIPERRRSFGFTGPDDLRVWDINTIQNSSYNCRPR